MHVSLSSLELDLSGSSRAERRPGPPAGRGLEEEAVGAWPLLLKHFKGLHLWSTEMRCLSSTL